MKRFLTGLVAMVVASCAPAPAHEPEQAVGTIEDLPHFLERLLQADPSMNPILIVQVGDVRDRFIQFAAHETEVELDHPLVTDAQKGREQAGRAALVEVGCEPKVNPGSGGTRFLDCYLPRSAERLREVSETVLVKALRHTTGTPVTYLWSDL